MQINAAATALRLSSQTVEASSPSTHCRYKTGRCPNPRAVKANGTLLLLCQYHRNQQNRTKKRSDMKCRHDRAKKRQAQRETLHKKHQPAVSLDLDQNVLGWSSITSLASITVPQIDEYAVPLSDIGSPEELDKSHESTSPTAVDIDVSSVNWAPQCLSPISTPISSLDPEDLLLLEYFIL
jgi:hypothetical protein